MAASKQYFPIFPAGTNVPAGTTKASPVVVNVVDARAAYGGEIVWRITNGGALGAACTITFQTSSDGSNWFDYQNVYSSDLLSGTVTNGPSIALGKGGMYVRAIAWGNTTNACAVEGGIQLVTGQ
jgi:hypothetical protein